MKDRHQQSDTDFANLIVGTGSFLKLSALEVTSKEHARLEAEIQVLQERMISELSSQTDLLREQLDTQRKLLAGQELQTKLALLSELRGRRQRELRNAAFDAHREVEACESVSDPLVRHLRLEMLRKDIAAHGIAAEELEELGDKKFAAEVHKKLSAALEETAPQVGKEDMGAVIQYISARKDRLRAESRLRELKSQADSLRMRAGSSKLSRSRETTLPPRDQLKRGFQIGLVTAVAAMLLMVVFVVLAGENPPEDSRATASAAVFLLVSMVAFGLAFLMGVLWIKQSVAARNDAKSRRAVEAVYADVSQRLEMQEKAMHDQTEVIQEFENAHPGIKDVPIETDSVPDTRREEPGARP